MGYIEYISKLVDRKLNPNTPLKIQLMGNENSIEILGDYYEYQMLWDHSLWFIAS